MRYDLIEIYKFLKGYNKVDVENLKKRTWLQEMWSNIEVCERNTFPFPVLGEYSIFN